MLQLLRYYYLQHFFPYDPLGSWLRHSIKSVLACLIAATISLYLMNAMALWIFIPVLVYMFIVDADQSLKQRLLLISGAGVASTVAAVAISLLSFSLLAQYALFLLIVFIGIYVSHNGVNAGKIGVMAILFSMMAFAYHIQINQLLQLAVYLTAGTLICLGVTLFIWPHPVSAQIRKNFDVGIFMMTRYICIVLSDVVRGSSNVKECSQREKLLLNVQQTLNVLVKSEDENSVLRNIMLQFNLLIQRSILVENSLKGLTVRVLLVGPLPRLQIILDLLTPVMKRMRQQSATIANTQQLEQQIKLFAEEASNAQAQARKYITVIPRDYLQWSIVSYALQQFIEQLVKFNQAYAELQH